MFYECSVLALGLQVARYQNCPFVLYDLRQVIFSFYTVRITLVHKWAAVWGGHVSARSYMCHGEGCSVWDAFVGVSSGVYPLH